MTTDTSAAIEEDEIRQQIDESTLALVEKLEKLEDKVAETVQKASTSVAEATASVIDTVNSATASVSETIETVNSAVKGTVQNVSNTVSDTAESVKETFDLPAQIRKHPWEMFAGAIVLGYAGGCFLEQSSSDSDLAKSKNRFVGSSGVDNRSSVRSAAITPSQNSSATRSDGDHSSMPSLASASPPAAKHSFLDLFGEEVNKLQRLAIGVSLGVIRDLLAESVPTSIRPQIAEVIDSFTDKLGGEHIRGSVIPKV